MIIHEFTRDKPQLEHNMNEIIAACGMRKQYSMYS